MSLKDWATKTNNKIYVMNTKCLIVYSIDPELWHLDDYYVSTSQGSVVYLCFKGI